MLCRTIENSSLVFYPPPPPIRLPPRGARARALNVTNPQQAWMGYRTAVFTVDDYRRRALGAGPCASFYDPHSPSEVAALRGACIDQAWADMMAAFDPAAASGARSSSESKASDGGGGGIDIAIFDDNNTTRSARRALAERVATGREGLQLMFIESAVKLPANPAG